MKLSRLILAQHPHRPELAGEVVGVVDRLAGACLRLEADQGGERDVGRRRHLAPVALQGGVAVQRPGRLQPVPVAATRRDQFGQDVVQPVAQWSDG